jgi:hypothetical protein
LQNSFRVRKRGNSPVIEGELNGTRVKILCRREISRGLTTFRNVSGERFRVFPARCRRLKILRAWYFSCDKHLREKINARFR